MTRAVLFALLLVTGCATLGPVPATTGVSSVPAGRFDGTVQAGVMPGYYLSQSTVEKPKGAGIGQLAAVIEAGRAVPGLVVGGRIFGPGDDTVGEPVIGYRRALGRLSIAGFAFATQSRAKVRSASYQATQGGAEVAVDLRITPRENRYAEPHVLASLSMTGVSADGTYCQDDTHDHGVDCPEPPAAPTNVTTANVSGAYPAFTFGLAADLGRHLRNPFHGARLEALAAVGMMPHVVAGAQESAKPYFTIGLAISISAGAR